MKLFIASWAAILMVAMISAPQATQDRAADLRSRFRNETNPIQRAKLMPALGEAEFQQIRQDVEAERLRDALAKLREYRDQAQSCAEALESTKTDAERHPAGFKQLEISVRESLRRIDALLPSMTRDNQAPFLELRKELSDLNRRLIEQLFPERTPSPPKSDSKGG